MKKLLWISFVATIVVLNAGCANGMTVAKVRLLINVVDDGGNPVPEVKLHGSGWIPGKYGASIVDAVTDKKGFIELKVKTSDDVGFTFRKDGYYESRMHYSVAEGGAKIEKGYWLPNPKEETVVLKRIKNPVPMYAKNLYDIKVPVLGKPVGYDLMVGDWVAPYGKGTVSDFIMNVTGEYRGAFDKDIQMTVTFSNDKDGIQSFYSLPYYSGSPLGSALWSSHEAPFEGYEPIYEYKSISALAAEDRKNIGPKKERNFYFRVRTELDEKGNIKKAMYGKIYQDFYCRYSGDKQMKIYFKYYLNPDHTRNMEFDPKQNLFNNLGYMEKVGYP